MIYNVIYITIIFLSANVRSRDIYNNQKNIFMNIIYYYLLYIMVLPNMKSL